MAQTKKTDNHYTKDKIMLRINNMQSHDEIKVIDCYAGHGVVWKSIEKNTDKQIQRLPIDHRDDLKSFHLHGENDTFLLGMDLSKFNVIDLDAYGVPYQQLKCIFDSKFRGDIFITFIQTMQGNLPHDMLIDIGYSKAMIKKIPTLFARNGWDVFKQWLAFNGVTSIRHRSKARKHYLYFAIQ